jgi:hypothetical protein
MKKRLEDFQSEREYLAYRDKQNGWFDFTMTVGLLTVGFGSMILIMVLGK